LIMVVLIAVVPFTVGIVVMVVVLVVVITTRTSSCVSSGWVL